MEVSSKNSINNDKSLCLYCDKTFANVKDQKNHVERDHKTILCKGKGSRKSERITKNNSSSENSPFPGCFHCNKKVIRTDDLDNLYQHLLSAHKDVYFGCKCKIRTQDKVSLTNHKKNCKIGGGGKATRYAEENQTDNRKTAKKSQTSKNNGDSKCDSLSGSEDNVAAAAANNSKILPANAIQKKSDRSKLKNLSKNASVNDKGKKNKLSSSSSTTSSSSSNKTAEDEYTIPLTRQKLKEPPPRQFSTLNRTPGNKKSHKTNKINDVKGIITASPPTKVNRTKTNKVVNANAHNPEPVESVLKNEPVSFEFDEDFYRNISQNIRQNLLHFVDGKSDRLQHRRPVFDHISEQASACCTTAKKAAIPVHEEEIHESTNFELSTPFPALLTAEQYGFGDSNPNKNKRQITKNSWKWKWDLIKKYKYVNEGGKIVKKVKQITTGLKDLSQLDMWTQLSMRSRYENLNIQNGLTTEFDEGLSDKLSMRTIKTQNIEQLNAILDKCLTPEIDIEQLQQTVIKLEPEPKENMCESLEAKEEADEVDEKSELFGMFNLVKTNVPRPSKTQLSGEWARPRCYICLDCGLEFDLMKNLNDHKNSEHPYVVSSHYEIVGRENLEHKLYKHLFLPKKALQASGFARSLSVNSDSKSTETNEASTSSDNSSKFFADQKEKECSKCLKMIKYSSDIDIHKHILECIEDRVWMQAKRRSKYRRSRRKSRKNTRKSRLSIDQKKVSSSPSTKDNTEGENSTPSISNPPTPNSDPKTPISSKINKIEPLLSENKKLNGKSNERMSIKNFFKVSKTTPAVPQKVVVQMLEIPSNEGKSLRSSLRSSAAKKQVKSDKNQKNSPPKVENSMIESVPEIDGETCSEKKVEENSDEKEGEIEVPNTEAKNPLIPLTICTPEKTVNDLQLISPASSTSLVSPTSNSNVPKKKKKLNDCIAMLTCKIQEKLGVNFFDSISNQPATPEKPVLEPPIALPVPVVSKTTENKPSTSFQIESLLKENVFSSPIQDEVIDLSVRKKSPCDDEAKTEISVEETEVETVVKESKIETAVNEFEALEEKLENLVDPLIETKEVDIVTLIPEIEKNEFKTVETEKEKVKAEEHKLIEKIADPEVTASGAVTENSQVAESGQVTGRSQVTESTPLTGSSQIIESSQMTESSQVTESSQTTEDVVKEDPVPIHCVPKDEEVVVEIKRKVTKNLKKPKRSAKRTKKASPKKKKAIKLKNSKPFDLIVEPKSEELEITANLEAEIQNEKQKLEFKDEITATNVISTETTIEPPEGLPTEEITDSIIEMEKENSKPETVKETQDAIIKNSVKKEDTKINEKAHLEASESNKATQIEISGPIISTQPEGGKEPETPEVLPEEVKKVLIEELETNESFKISIPKNKIPNLKEILDQYQVITVNNIKISESERRAFEEQKNRILQILNKSKNASIRKTPAKKVPVRKVPVRKAPARKNPKKREPAVKSKPATPVKEVEKPPVETVVEKIEEAIKTTNRIRCRRLSVVVDPIISLTNFQNKNRKIRLTNNSQQNGFYDLLTASEQFFTDNKAAKEKIKTALQETPKTLEEVKPEDETKPTDPETLAAAPEVDTTESPTKATRAAKATAKELIASDKSKEVVSKKTENSPQKPKTKAAEKMLLTAETAIERESENATDGENTMEKPPEPEKVELPLKKGGKGKKQNEENISTALEQPENIIVEIEKKAEEVMEDLPKAPKRKTNAKNSKKKNVLPLEEIKVEQSVKTANVKELPEKRRKLPRGRTQPAVKEENLLDISFSSDTSNENDIPLAQLIAPEVIKKPEVEKVFKPKEIEKAIEENDLKNEEVETSEESSVPKETFEEPENLDQEINIISQQMETPKPKSETRKASIKKPAKKKQAPVDKTPVQESKKVERIHQILLETPKEPEEEIEPPEELPVVNEEVSEKFDTFLNKTSSMIDLSASSDVETKKSYDPFTINEDSLFNDDLDNDPSDKINDIVNNIINSSEFQIDSDTEKSEIYQASLDDKNQLLPNCTICKRTFRTEKVLEKHCMTSTHKMKVERKNRGIARLKDPQGSKVQVQPDQTVALERAPSPILDEAKVFRTKGALKTFDTVLDVPLNEKPKVVDEVKPVEIAAQAKNELTREQKMLNANDDKIYYEFKMEKKPEDMTAKDKDQLFDSLFNSLEAKAQEKKTCYTPKPNFATPQDSEMESSSTSWDLKHDADIEWEAETTENVPFANAIKQRYPKKFPVRVNKSKDTAVSIPTKSLIMGKIFKKHRDREKQKTPQADAPNNKPGIKNSLDEIFDHLKNTAEIDDKVLTCPSPKTLLKNVGGTFSPHSSNSNDMLETASQSNNNNIYKSKALRTTPEKDEKKVKVNIAPEPQLQNDSMNEDCDDGIGKRKSRRRCAIKAKTFAETWSSDEYEELHDTEDIISIINEIEKRESIRKRKLPKVENHVEKFDSVNDEPVKSDKPSSIMKSSEMAKSSHVIETPLKVDKKKSVQILDILKTDKPSSAIKKRRMSTTNDGHKSDEETFTATKDSLPLKAASCIKKRRMSCFVPSTPFVERPKSKPVVEKPKVVVEKPKFVQEKPKFVQEKPKLVQEKPKPMKETPLRIEAETLRRFEKTHEIFEPRQKASSVKKSDSEKSFKNQKKFATLLSNFGGQVKKKVQKHRKRPRNKVKNIAYDSDSDFELNLNKKSRAAAATPAPFSESSSSSFEDDDEETDNVSVATKPTKTQTVNHSRSTNANDMTMIKEPKLLPNDLKHVVPSTTSSTFKAAIPEDILDPSQCASNRTKRHSSEKLYYWSSSSSESDQEQGDTADGDNEDSVMPHQPEQHGWIVGDSHKKLVTLLAHAKIKNKIN